MLPRMDIGQNTSTGIIHAAMFIMSPAEGFIFS